MAKQYHNPDWNQPREKRQWPNRTDYNLIQIEWSEITTGLQGNASEVATFIEILKKKVKNEMKEVTASQLRNVYDELKRAQTPFDVQKVRIMMLYMSGKSDKGQVKKTWEWLEKLAADAKDDETVKLYHEFWRALIAIHKFMTKK